MRHADPHLAGPLRVDIGHGALSHVPGLLEECGLAPNGRIAVMIGPGHGGLVEAALDRLLSTAEIAQVAGPTLAAARSVVEHFGGGAFDVLVGVGGGGTLDVAKHAAGHLSLPMVAVATNLAHDGLASPVAALVVGDRKCSIGVPAPVVVVVDLDHVAASPPRQTRSGVGDVVSNLGAVADWRLAHRILGDPIDGLASSLARTAAASVVHHPGPMESEDFLQTLAEALVLSGIAMSVAGSSRPCSGACHAISHAIDALYPGSATHGEQVAVGAMFASYLRGGGGIAAVDRCFRRHGVARLPADLGLSADQFAAAVHQAPVIRPDRWTVLNRIALTEEGVRKHVDEFVAAFNR